MAARVFVGTAGWSYRDWEGVVYPSPRPRSLHGLEFLGQYFSACEINSSFYHIPSSKNARSWVEHVSAHRGFQFTVKLWQGFTHGAMEGGTAGAGGGTGAGGGASGGGATGGGALPRPQGGLLDRESLRAFYAFLEPLASSDRLGCLLAQFPWSFRFSEASWDYLDQLARAFSAYPLAIEVRHASWLKAELLRWLTERGVAWVNIDQPLMAGSLEPTRIATAPFFYVRLHGRNQRTWFDPRASVEDRYDYLYAPEELAPWVETVKALSLKTERGFVVTNNHARGQAVANGLELEAALEQKFAPPPATLLSAYPELKRTETFWDAKRAVVPHGTEQPDLFGEEGEN